MIPDFARTAIISGERRVSFSDMLKKISQFADVSLYNKGTKCVIFSENREGWLYALYSIWKNKGIVVPVDAQSTVNDLAYILNDCQPEFVWTSKKKVDIVKKAAEKVSGYAGPKVMLIDDYELTPAEELKSTIDEKNSGLENLFCDDREDTCIICYTSGTTGSPKGVVLSFKNVFANVAAVSTEVEIFHPKQRTLILLPLHHVLPLVGTAVIPILVGGGVAICPSLTGPDILRTLKEAEIGLMIGVPRLWLTIVRGVMNKINASPITRGLFKLCEKVNSYGFSKFVFSAVHKKLGGHLEYMVSGGAALDHESAHALKVLGFNLLEGYGMTELAPMISFTRPYDLVIGSAGKALPSVQVVYKDGELCAKGPNLMKGYYNRPEETAAVIDEEGFMHTGDLAHEDAEGHIFITGRKKEIIVLSNGKNINPVEIEDKIEHYGDMVKEAAVTHADDVLCAIVVPQADFAEGRSDEEIEAALKHEVIEPYNEATESYKRVLRVVIYHGDLPRTRMEKLQRFKLQAIVKGEFKEESVDETIVEPSFEEYGIIKNYIFEEKHRPVRPTDNLETDLAFDSLDKVGLQSFLELTFGLKLSVERIAMFRSVQELAEHVSDYKTRIEVEKTDWKELLTQPLVDAKLPHTFFTAHMIVDFFSWFCKSHMKVKTIGKENMPKKGPFIIAVNHQSFLDGAFVAGNLPYSMIQQTYVYAKAKHVVNNPIVKKIADTHNIIVSDTNQMKEGIQMMGEALRRGKNLMIFPEGTRTNNGKLGQFKKMYAILSKELNVPILPVAISGAYEALPKGTHWPKKGTKITVEFLPTVTPREGESYDELSDRVRNCIAAVLH